MENFVVQTGSYDTAKDPFIGEETITFFQNALEDMFAPKTFHPIRLLWDNKNHYHLGQKPTPCHHD
jgi:hypothetical protein